VPLVSKPLSLACRAERLAGAASGPDWFVVGPPGEPEGVGPAADPSEEVALGVAPKLVWSDIPDVSLIHLSIGQDAGLD
jgi:hypothetical protein